MTKPIKECLRGGMIGAGIWSDFQLGAWAKVPNAEIIALCDRHPERITPLAEKFAIKKTYDSFNEMLNDQELDFIDVCTRPYSHVPLVKGAADRGLPVLCQKPFCQNLEEAIDLVEYCENKGVRLMVNENFRWQTHYRKLKELLEQGYLGSPFLFKHTRRVRMTLPEFNHYQTYFTEMPNFILYEMGVHYLDTCRYLFGEPKSVYARLHKASPHVKGEDVQILIVGYEGLSVVINTSWASVGIPLLDVSVIDKQPLKPPRIEIDGTKGTISFDWSGGIHLYTDDDHQVWDTGEGESLAVGAVKTQSHFVDCLITGKEFETSGRDYLKTMELVYACYESAETNQVIKIS